MAKRAHHRLNGNHERSVVRTLPFLLFVLCTLLLSAVSGVAHAAAITVHLETDVGTPLPGIHVYAFTEGMAYTQLNAVADGSGIAAFNSDDFAEGHYRFRTDYLGQQFWSGLVAIPAETIVSIVIPHRSTEVTVISAAGPVAGAPVYLFSDANAYLSQNGQTDEAGKALFGLPVGKSFMFRADLFGSQYWSDVLEIPADGASAATISTGGGLYNVTLKKSADEPIAGVPVYLFTEAGVYLSQNQTSNAAGQVAFNVPSGRYKVRADYLRGQFWSDVVEAVSDIDQELTIPHQEVTISVAGIYQAETTPLEGVAVYLFNGSGVYLNINAATDSQGDVSFSLPQMEFRARADYLHGQFWSDNFSGSSAAIGIPMAEADVSVTWGSGYLAGVPVYAFNSAGIYLGVNRTTNSEGSTPFRLPAGAYRFRGDYQSAQYWSEDVTLITDQTLPVTVSTGGGSFTLTVQKAAGQPMEGVPCYLFSEAGSYLGLNASTSSDGTVAFDTATGNFKIRVDYLGYQFWTPVFNVPDALAMTLDIPHRDCAVQVTGVMSGANENRANIPVYLFTPGNAYLGRLLTTDADGLATFSLPDQPYKVRADYLGMQFWSGNFQYEDTSVSIPEGIAEVSVSGAGQNLSGVNVYAFNSAGSYLGLAGATDANGMVTFRLPGADYRFRADYQSSQYWSEDLALQPDQSNAVAISCGGGDFALSLSDGSSAMEGVSIYVFNSAGTYIGLNGATDVAGEARFALSDGTFRFRADYMGYQFWSADFEVPTVLSGILAIPHQDIQVTVSASYPAATAISNIPVFLFTEAGAYQGQNATTDTGGVVSFRLPDQSYKVRADYMGSQYWSDPFQLQDATVAIPRGELVVHVVNAGSDVAGANVYAFSEAGSYLNLNATTGSDGRAAFVLPAANYKFRVDLSSQQHWTNMVAAADGQSDTVTIDISPINVSIGAEPLLIAPGDSTTLTWNSEGAATCSISPGIGGVALSGVMQVTPAATTEYAITATSGDTSVVDSVTVVVNTAPTITLLEPDGTGDTADASFTITWQDSDPEQNAAIDLYYDTDGTGEDGTPIITDLMEDDDGAAGSYSWNTSALAEGNYYIYAVIDDGIADPVAQYSAGPLSVSHEAVELSEAKLGAMEKLMMYSLGRSVSLSGDFAIAGATNCYAVPGQEIFWDVPEGAPGFAYLYKRQADQWIPHSKLTSDGAFFAADNPGKQIELRVDGPGYNASMLARTRTATNQRQCLTFPEGEYIQYLTCYKPTGSGPVRITAIDFLVDGIWESRLSTDWWLPAEHMTYQEGQGWLWTGMEDRADYGILRISGTWAEDFRPEAIRVAYLFEDHMLSSEIESFGFGHYYWGYDEPSSSYLYVSINDWETGESVDLRVPGNDPGGGDGYLELLSTGDPLPPSVDYENPHIPSRLATVMNNFGYAVALNDDIAVVGAPLDSRSNEALGAGAVFVFERDGDGWIQTAKLVAEDPEASAMLGYAVAVGGDTIVAGAPGKSEADTASGAIYVFKKSGDRWLQNAKLAPADGSAEDWFGTAVATDGARIAAGVSQGWTDYSGPRGPGKAYIYIFNGSGWVLETTLTAMDGLVGDEFGAAVSIDGDRVAIGAPGVSFETNDAYRAGAVYVFNRMDGQWQQDARLASPNPQHGDYLGVDVSIEGTHLIAGSNQYDSLSWLPGTALVFENKSGSWDVAETLVPTDGGEYDNFGSAVALDNGRYMVGAKYHSDDEELWGSGKAYIFAPPQTSAYIEADPHVTLGGDITLRWSTSHADTVTISPDIGSADPSGEMTVSVTATTVFSVTATGPYGTETYQATVFVNTPPSISLLSPDGFANIADQAFSIVWDDQDADSNASVSLYYDNDRCGADGTLIAEGVAEDPEADGDTFVWNPTEIPEGDYFIYAVIDDGLNTPVVAYSSGSITIKHSSVGFIPRVAGGGGHSVGIEAEGRLYAWGANDHGQLGDGTNVDRTIPVIVGGIDRVIDVACGTQHTVALRENGTVWAWGLNSSGQLGLGDNQDRNTPTRIPNLSGVKSLDTMYSTTIALKNDGTVWAWGNNEYGTVGDGTTIDKNAPVQVLNLSNIVEVSSGGYHTAALSSDGYVYTWGSNNHGQLGGSYPTERSNPGVTYGISGVTAIACGYTHTLALKNDGTVWAWGDNEDGQLGDGSNISKDYPVMVTGLTDIVQIAAGYLVSAALSADGDVWVWGYNGFGQIGDGTKISSNIPRRNTVLQNVLQLETGWHHCLALKEDGTVWTWGSNFNDQLGYETVDADSPVPAQTVDPVGTGHLELFDPAVPQASVVLGASTTTVLEGQSVSLIWSSSGVDTVEITPDIGAVALTGSMDIAPATTTTYVISGSGPGGFATDRVTIAVIPKPIINFYAIPGIIDSGGSVTLHWNVTYAETVEIDQGIGSVGLEGTWLKSPTDTTTYTLTATGPAGTSTANLTVYVREYMQTVIEYEYDEIGRIRRKTFTNQ